MKKNNYTKPNITFFNLQNTQNIAGSDGPCMPQASHGHRDFYYDAPGDGWVVITSLAENCNGNAKFEYYDNPSIEGTVSDEEKNAAIAKAQKALAEAKQAFTGSYLDPQPSWS